MSKVTFKTARGATVEVELVRNSKLGVNGWLPSKMHEIQIKVNGDSYSYYDAVNDATHGYSLKIGPMGKITVPVTKSSQEAIRALVNEYDDNNSAVIKANAAEEAEYAAHTAKIKRGMDA